MIKSKLAFTALTLLQEVHPPEPRPKGVPPVGDVVPIDSYVLAVFVITLIAGVAFVFVKSARKTT